MKLQRESSTHYHVPEERADLFHCHDGGSTEYEYLEFLKALILTLKPKSILETGTYLGFGARAIAEAIQFNGFGRLTTIDCVRTYAAQADETIGELGFKVSTGELVVSRIFSDSLEFLRETLFQFDFAFFDSDLNIRCQEFVTCIERGLLLPGATAVFHDTSRLRAWPETGSDPATHLFWSMFEKIPGLTWMEFPLSRGMVIARKA